MPRFIDDLLQKMRTEYTWERSQGLEGTKKAIIENAVKRIKKSSDEAKIKNELGKKGIISCPPGYRWDNKKKDCVPKTPQDSVGSGRGDVEPRNGPGYNTWGHTGVNGDGYAWAEPNAWGDGGGYGGGGSIAGAAMGMSEAKKTCKGCGKQRCTCVCPRCAVSKARCRCIKPQNLSDSFNI